MHNKQNHISMNRNLIKTVAIFLFIFMASCAQTTYYQLVNTKPVSEDLKKEDKSIVYEDKNCIIRYNLWTEEGTTEIMFENKTDEDIYLDMGASFYIFNNQAFDLYCPSTKSKTTSRVNAGGIYWGFGISTAQGVRTKSTIVKHQQQIITIPAKMYKIIGETDIKIAENIYRDCTLLLKPDKKSVYSTHFTLADTPYRFGLRLAYYVGNQTEPIKIKNEFYVDKITNYPSQLFKESYTSDKVCPDEKVMGKTKTRYIYKSADSFYLEYNPDRVGSTSNGGVLKH